MNETSNGLVFWILIPLFLAVGLHLFLYSRRRKKMLEAFAKSNQLTIRPEREGTLQKILDISVSSTDAELLRTFDQISSLVEGESIWMFRAVELFDVNPGIKAPATHFSRVAALFEVSAEWNEFFLLDKYMHSTNRLSGSALPDSRVVEAAKRAATTHEGRHTLSVTLKNGYGLIYFEPLVTGGEKLEDVNSLYSIASELRTELSS